MHFRADYLEGEVLTRLKRFEAPKEMKARIRAKAKRLAQQVVGPEWKNAQRRVNELTRKLERLKEMRIEGEITKFVVSSGVESLPPRFI